MAETGIASPAAPSDLAAELGACLSALIEDNASGIKSAVVRLDMPAEGWSWEAAAGTARPDTNRPMTSATCFHLASVAKTMTAVLILKLYEAGRFGADGLDARLSDLGVFSDEVISRLHHCNGKSYGEAITLRHLLTHTSGMKDAMVDDGDGTAADMGGLRPGSLIGQIFADPMGRGQTNWTPWDAERPFARDAGTFNFYLNADGVATSALNMPGAGFHYSDTGYVILGLVAEHFYGAPLHDLWRREIFAPLGLQHTYLAYHDDPPLGENRAPEAEIWAGDQACLTAGLNLSFDWAGGGIVSTAGELNRFLMALFDGRFFSAPSTFRLMTDWSTPNGLKAPRTGVGLGLFRTAGPAGELWGHSGAWGARMFADQASGIYFSGTVNQIMAANDWHYPFLSAAARRLNTELPDETP